ncbi:unnamed protein product [Paramecium sonneborni]|uniref:Uncharacterized protein n=1 Tax=Paramecium sonneborni TaxID=65129 RepID=A0A8S1LYM0_9CILI|nr:unnamed protein product [Paramecium sonneborni]
MAQQSIDMKSKLDKTIKRDEIMEPQQEKNSKQIQDKIQENNETETKKKKDGGQLESLFQNNGTNLFNILGVTLYSNRSLFGTLQINRGMFGNINNKEPNNNGIDLTKPCSSLFGIDFKVYKSDDSDGAEDIGQEDEQKQEDEEPKQIEMKYDYSTQTDQLLILEIEKFRINTNDVLEKGTVALEKSKDSSVFYFIYRNQIQQILYTGQLLKGISQIKPLGSKQENILLRAMSRIQKTQSQEQYPVQIDTLKIMLKDKENAELFKEKISNLFN